MLWGCIKTADSETFLEYYAEETFYASANM